MLAYHSRFNCLILTEDSIRIIHEDTKTLSLLYFVKIARNADF